MVNFCIYSSIVLRIILIYFNKRSRISSFNHLAQGESCLLFLNCVVAVCVLYLFLTVPWEGLQSVFVAFPGHTLTLIFQYGK